MRDAGYVEGRNLVLEVWTGDGSGERVTAMVTDILALAAGRHRGRWRPRALSDGARRRAGADCVQHERRPGRGAPRRQLRAPWRQPDGDQSLHAGARGQADGTHEGGAAWTAAHCGDRRLAAPGGDEGARRGAEGRKRARAFDALLRRHEQRGRRGGTRGHRAEARRGDPRVCRRIHDGIREAHRRRSRCSTGFRRWTAGRSSPRRAT